MKVYVASSWRTPTHPDVVAALRTAGHDVYDYRDEGFEWSDVGMDKVNASYVDMRRVLLDEAVETQFEKDLKALDWADALVLVLPAGRSAHTEFGYMCGRQGDPLTIIIWSPSEPDLLHLLADEIVSTIDEVVIWLHDVEQDLTTWRVLHA